MIMNMFKYFPSQSRSVDECISHYETSLESGLSEKEAFQRLDVCGLNELTKEKPTPMWRLVLEQFDDYLIKILLASAAFSLFLAIFQNNGEGITAFVEPFVILLILIINAIIGVWQENNATSALSALKKMQSEKARCIRDGVMNPNLLSEELVPGDVIRVRVSSPPHSLAVRRRQGSGGLPHPFPENHNPPRRGKRIDGGIRAERQECECGM